MPELFAEIWQRLFFTRGQRNTVFSRDPEKGEVRDWLLPQGLSIGRLFCLLQLYNVFSMPWVGCFQIAGETSEMTHSTALKKKKIPKNHTTHFCSYKTAKPRFLPQSRIVTDGGKAGERAFFFFLFHFPYYPCVGNTLLSQSGGKFIYGKPSETGAAHKTFNADLVKK